MPSPADRADIGALHALLASQGVWQCFLAFFPSENDRQALLFILLQLNRDFFQLAVHELYHSVVLHYPVDEKKHTCELTFLLSQELPAALKARLAARSASADTFSSSSSSSLSLASTSVTAAIPSITLDYGSLVRSLTIKLTPSAAGSMELALSLGRLLPALPALETLDLQLGTMSGYLSVTRIFEVIASVRPPCRTTLCVSYSSSVPEAIGNHVYESVTELSLNLPLHYNTLDDEANPNFIEANNNNNSNNNNSICISNGFNINNDARLPSPTLTPVLESSAAATSSETPATAAAASKPHFDIDNIYSNNHMVIDNYNEYFDYDKIGPIEDDSLSALGYTHSSLTGPSRVSSMCGDSSGDILDPRMGMGMCIDMDMMDMMPLSPPVEDDVLNISTLFPNLTSLCFSGEELDSLRYLDVRGLKVLKITDIMSPAAGRLIANNYLTLEEIWISRSPWWARPFRCAFRHFARLQKITLRNFDDCFELGPAMALQFPPCLHFLAGSFFSNTRAIGGFLLAMPNLLHFELTGLFRTGSSMNDEIVLSADAKKIAEIKHLYTMNQLADTYFQSHLVLTNLNCEEVRE